MKISKHGVQRKMDKMSHFLPLPSVSPPRSEREYKLCNKTQNHLNTLKARYKIDNASFIIVFIGMLIPLAFPFFFFVYRRMRFLILGRSVGLKKKNLKKNHKKSRNSRPWYPRTTLKVNIHAHIWTTECTIYREKCSCFCSSFSLCCYYVHFSDNR